MLCTNWNSWFAIYREIIVEDTFTKKMLIEEEAVT